MGRRPTYNLPNDEVLALYREGLSDRAIGARYGVDGAVIEYWRGVRGHESNRRKSADRIVDEIRRMAAQGCTDGEMAMVLKRDESVIRKRRDKLGIPRVDGWSGAIARRSLKPSKARMTVPVEVTKYEDDTDYEEVDRTALAWCILSNGGALAEVARECRVTVNRAKVYRRQMPKWWRGERA